MVRVSGGAVRSSGLFRAAEDFFRKFAKAGGTDAERAAARDAERLPYYGAGRVDSPQSPMAERAYEQIRNTTGDTERIAQNTGIRQDVLDRVKKHLFETEHRNVPVGPNDLRNGRFAEMDHIADLWQKADRGTLSGDEAERFRRLMAHEGVESRLMQDGMPYRSAHPDAWDEEGTYWPSSDHFGAHDVSPHETASDPFRAWPRMGLEHPGIELNDDLSNLDDVIAAINRGIGR